VTVSPTWMTSSDQTAAGNRSLVYRPGVKVDVSAGAKIGRFRLNGDYQSVGRRFTRADNSKTLGSYELLGGNVQWNGPVLGFGIRLKMQVINLLDKNICLIEGYPIPGREWRFTVGFDG